MNTSLLQSLDPELYKQLTRGFDKHEVRGATQAEIEMWCLRTLAASASLDLVRRGIAELSGMEEHESGINEPLITLNLELFAGGVPTPEQFGNVMRYGTSDAPSDKPETDKPESEENKGDSENV